MIVSDNSDCGGMSRCGERVLGYWIRRVCHGEE